MIELLNVVVGQSGGGDQGGFLSLMMPMFIIFGIMYFLVIRPQSKKQREHENLLNNLKSGDKIITQGGLVGRITNVEKEILTLDLGDRVRVKVMRTHVLGLQPRPGEDAKTEKDTKK